MMTHKRLHTIIAALTLLVVGLGATNWYLKPESARAWAIGIASMPVIWAIVTGLIRRRSLARYGDAERRFFTGSIIFAGLILAGSMAIKLIAALSEFDLNLLSRAWGVGIGVFLVLMGNVMPKILSPLAAQRCSPSKTQSLQRFAGWSFVLGGLGYAGAWVILPVKQAGGVATLICLASVTLVVLHCVWVFAKSRGVSSSP